MDDATGKLPDLVCNTDDTESFNAIMQAGETPMVTDSLSSAVPPTNEEIVESENSFNGIPEIQKTILLITAQLKVLLLKMTL